VHIKFDRWYRVQLGAGLSQGISRFEDVWVCFPSGAGTLTALDEWSVTETRTLAVASYSSRSILGAAGVFLTIDGDEYPYHNLDTKRTRPLSQSLTGGSKYAQTIQKNGKRMTTLDITRDRDDRYIFDKLIQGKTIGVVVDRYGLPYGATGISELWRSTYANCEVKKVTRDVDKEGTLQEKVTLEAKYVGGVPSYVDVFNTSLSTF
jgi:hypothetical protein